MVDVIGWHNNVEAGISGFPTLKEILNFRTLDSENEREWNIMKFVWTRLLPAGAGKTYWNKTLAHKCLVTDLLHVKDDEGTDAHRYRLPLSLEAFMLVTYENNLVKWKERLGDMVAGIKRGDKYYNQFTKFTDATNGQKEFAGWTTDGLKRFQSYKAAVQKRRIDGWCEENGKEYNNCERLIVIKLRKENPKAAGLVSKNPNASNKVKPVAHVEADLVQSDDELLYAVGSDEDSDTSGSDNDDDDDDNDSSDDEDAASSKSDDDIFGKNFDPETGNSQDALDVEELY